MLKKMLNGKKGLTLVELLAVLVILGIVAAIAVPSIGATIEKSRKRADVGTYHMIVDAATRYSLDQQMEPGNDGQVGASTPSLTTEPIQTLVDEGFLSATLDGSALPSQSDPNNIKFTSFTVLKDSGNANKLVVTVYNGTTVITESTFD